MSELITSPFMLTALAACLLLSAQSASLGCLMLWQRMAYFGEALAHGAISGVVLGLALQMPLPIGAFLSGLALALLLWVVKRRETIPSDTLIGVLAHGFLAAGMVGLSLLPTVTVDIYGILFGDILSLTNFHLLWLLVSCLIVLACTAFFWPTWLLMSLQQDLAKAEGFATKRAELAFLLLLAITIASAIQIVGLLLITSLLLLPAATARYYAKSASTMLFLAIIFGILASVGGIVLSTAYDIPTGPAIVLTAFILFLASAFRPLKK